MNDRRMLLSCEHGGTRIPPPYRHLFDSAEARRALRSHRGSDLGALSLARALQRATGVRLHASTVSRLLVDLNRSLGHPNLFSRFSNDLDPEERRALLERWYFPHRDAIESAVKAQARRGGSTLHIGVHSFAERVEGKNRNTDLGLLYDPSRSGERLLCSEWKETLGLLDPGLRVRRNYPYLGKADGLVTYLRTKFNARQYVGIELEVSQDRLSTPKERSRIAQVIVESIRRSAPNALPEL